MPENKSTDHGAQGDARENNDVESTSPKTSNAASGGDAGLDEAELESLDLTIETVEERISPSETNVFDTLILAMQDPEVNTIYFLSDGAPTSGSVTFRGQQLLGLQHLEHRLEDLDDLGAREGLLDRGDLAAHEFVGRRKIDEHGVYHLMECHPQPANA